jgi:hypothetical protein
MNSDGVITVSVDGRQFREAVLDLRLATLRAIGLCRDIIDRMDEAKAALPTEPRP